MKLRVLVTRAASIERYLRRIGEPTDVLPLSPARGPPFFKSRAVCEVSSVSSTRRRVRCRRSGRNNKLPRPLPCTQTPVHRAINRSDAGLTPCARPLLRARPPFGSSNSSTHAIRSTHPPPSTPIVSVTRSTRGSGTTAHAQRVAQSAPGLRVADAVLPNRPFEAANVGLV